MRANNRLQKRRRNPPPFRQRIPKRLMRSVNGRFLFFIFTKEELMMENIKKTLLILAATVFGYILLSANTAQAHCQIPCGIYDDHARVQSMLEDSATIEKSIALIAELAGKTDAQSQNQLVRWVINKEKHAQNIISSISAYFLTQRINPDQQDYAERLAKHHAVILAAMKAKQNADMQSAKNLRETITALLAYYPEHSK
jgi:nickel superoxide dismutase